MGVSFTDIRKIEKTMSGKGTILGGKNNTSGHGEFLSCHTQVRILSKQ